MWQHVMYRTNIALRAVAAIGMDEALAHMFVWLGDDQPAVQETRIHAVQPFSRRAVEPPKRYLQSAQRAVRTKEGNTHSVAPRICGLLADALMEQVET